VLTVPHVMMTQEVDTEVERLVSNAYNLAKEVLNKNMELLYALADRLVRVWPPPHGQMPPLNTSSGLADPIGTIIFTLAGLGLVHWSLTHEQSGVGASSRLGRWSRRL
jgi:hypothetical protein